MNSLTRSTAVTKPTKRKKNEYFKSAGDKARGVAAYVSTGSFTKASSITGIHENTLRYWAKQDWWSEEVLRQDKADSNELKSTFTRIAKRASEELEDRLEHGDEIVTKDGEIVKRRIPGKELAIISAVAADKRRQEIQMPNQVAVMSSTEKLAKLMEQFFQFSQAKEINAKNSRTPSDTTESEGVFKAVELRDSDIGSTEGGESQEGDHAADSEGGEAQRNDPSPTGEGQAS